jgi:putative transposase
MYVHAEWMNGGSIKNSKGRIQMFKAFKTEMDPTLDQIQTIQQSIGTCRWLYNQYISYNKEKDEKTVMGAMEFDKYVNQVLSKEYDWIKKCGSKARKKAIVNAETAFKRFFKGLAKFPRFKKKRDPEVKIYFPKNHATDLTVERRQIKVPTLGWVRLKEKGYIPTKGRVSSCTATISPFCLKKFPPRIKIQRISRIPKESGWI